MDNPELRKAVEATQPERVAFELRFAQSKPIYNAIMRLRNTPEVWKQLTPEQQRIVDISVKEFKTSGVGLEPEQRKKYNELIAQLAKLHTNFTNNVQDSTKVRGWAEVGPRWQPWCGIVMSVICWATQSVVLGQVCLQTVIMVVL